MPAPVIIGAIAGALVQLVGTLVGRTLVSLGIGYASYSMLDTSLNFLRTQIASAAGGLPAQVLAILSALQLGAGLSILISALLARLILEGLTGGAIKKMVLK